MFHGARHFKMISFYLICRLFAIEVIGRLMQKADQHQNRDRLQDVIEDLESQAASTTTSTNVPNGLTASAATSAGKNGIMQ